MLLAPDIHCVLATCNGVESCPHSSCIHTRQYKQPQWYINCLGIYYSVAATIYSADTHSLCLWPWE